MFPPQLESRTIQGKPYEPLKETDHHIECGISKTLSEIRGNIQKLIQPDSAREYVERNLMGGRSAYSVWPSAEAPTGLSSTLPEKESWPRISIVTPNFNYGHLIEATIRSVLLQEYPNLEYIVIDDGSSDDSLRVIKKYESKLGYFEHQENQGQYPTINKGFSKATGEILGWINSDDIYLPWTLSAVANIFTRFPEVDWIVGVPSEIQDGIIHSVRPLRPYPREMIRAGLFHAGSGWGDAIQQESCFWRRTLWEKSGGLQTALGYAADFELWTRFAKFAELYSVSTLLGGFTNRGRGNRSIANSERYMAEVEKVRAELGTDPQSPEAKLARNLAILSKLSGTVGVNAVARRLLSPKDLRGPTLIWRFKKSCYQLIWKSFF